MSADNYLAIYKEPDGKFRGYMFCASLSFQENERAKRGVVFERDTLEDAIRAAQAEPTEYGYELMNLE